MRSFNGDFPPWRCSGRQRRRGERRRHPLGNKPWKKKLKDELESVVGMNRKVEESDMEKLPYLDLVVKETLRLYPVAPLLVPRECREEITIDGYCIKERSRIIVNAWAIGRDPKVWSDNAEVFYPERFANSNVDMRVQS